MRISFLPFLACDTRHIHSCIPHVGSCLCSRGCIFLRAYVLIIGGNLPSCTNYTILVWLYQAPVYNVKAPHSRALLLRLPSPPYSTLSFSFVWSGIMTLSQDAKVMAHATAFRTAFFVTSAGSMTPFSKRLQSFSLSQS